MDEYLFIVLAKLKADRARLQVEAQLPRAPHEFFDGDSSPPPRHTRRARWFNAEAALVEAGWRDLP